MDRRLKLLGGLLAGALISAGTPAVAQKLTVMTAGDQNMVDYVNEFLAPKFEADNPGVTVEAIGTGPGDAGSQLVYERLSAQAGAGNEKGDVDVAVVPACLVS
jgi:ABC-type glycerol-3-phosphate transport system substrate-binding protein